MTLEVIKAKRLLKYYIESKNNQIKELQEQNAELVRMLINCKSLCEILKVNVVAKEIDELLTKHNHLKSNTNGK